MKKRNARLRLALRIIACAIACVVLVFVIYFSASGLAGNPMPMLFGRGMAVVLSGSMEPELSVNDLVFVKASKSYEEGDIVVYQSGRMLVIHRIISVSSDGETVTTQGDANDDPDNPIAVSAIKGKMTGKWHGAGVVITFLQSPAVMGIALAGALALIILPEFFKKKKKKEAEEPAAAGEEEGQKEPSESENEHDE